MSEGGLLASSTHYGVVSRSNPLSGKVLRGFLDAAGTMNGLGIGNPNAEFSPNVCLCRIFTEKSTAKILWGFAHGEVAITTANKVTDPSRTSPAKFSRSLVSEQHGGTVTDAVWGEGGNIVLTASVDGKVKLWDAARMRCLWTSPVPQDPPFSTSFPSRLGFDSRKGIAAVVFSGGDTFIWWGLLPFYVGGGAPQVNEVNIPPGLLAPQSSPGVSHLVLNTKDGISLLVHHLDSAHFHRRNVDFVTGEVETIKFGEESRVINSLKLVTLAQGTASPFVLVGDWLGSLSVYDWNSSHGPEDGFIQPAKRITAFDDGDAVTSVEWNPWVMATGSSTGAVKVWDSLKFQLLRAFQPPTRGHAGHPSIALEREMIAIAFGDKITSWKASPVRKGNKVVHGGKKGKNNALAKWRRKSDDLTVPPIGADRSFTEQVDMHRDISESRKEIEEERSWRRAAHGREKDQFDSLEALGLNEQEALEYVLMLSRDEEERRDPTSENLATPPSFTQSYPVPSSSNAKVRTSPRTKIEAWSAGVAGSPGSPEMARSVSAGSDLSDEKEFPAMGESVSSHGSGIGGTTTPIKPQRSTGSSPNAWNTPLKSSCGPGTTSPKRVTATVSMSPSPPSSTHRRAERGYRSTANEESQEDRDLKLAIELSLAEATNKSGI